MDCERATNLMSARIDGELPEMEAASIELDAHLAGCATCRAAAEAMQAQDAALVRAFAGHRRTADAVAEAVVDRWALKVGVAADVAAEATQSQVASPVRASMSIWPRVVAAAAAGFLLGIVVLRYSPVGDRVWSLLPRGPVSPKISTGDPSAHPDQAARIYLTTGEVFTCPPSGTEWQVATAGSPLAPDTRIRTPAPSRCELRLPDGAQVCLNGDTQARLTGDRCVELERGQVWSAVPAGSAPVAACVAPAGGRPAGAPPATAITPPGGQTDLACTTGGEAILTVVRGAGRVADGRGAETTVNAGEAVRLVGGVPVGRDVVPDPIGATRWVNELLVLRDRDDPELLARVNELLSRIRTEAATRPAAIAAAPGPQEQEVRAQGDLWSGPMACYVLSPASRAEHDKRLAAARLLADLAPPWTIPDLIAILGDRDGEVRENAAKALQRLTGQQFGDAPYLCATESSAAASQRQRQWQVWWEQNHARYPKPPARR